MINNYLFLLFYFSLNIYLYMYLFIFAFFTFLCTFIYLCLYLFISNYGRIGIPYSVGLETDEWSGLLHRTRSAPTATDTDRSYVNNNMAV